MSEQARQPEQDQPERAQRETVPGPDEPHGQERRTDTVHTGHGPDGVPAESDVVSDPAHDDRVGSDWTDEGGATTRGPAKA